MGPNRDRLLGRDQELAVLRRALDTARASEATFVVLSGEAGIGKSRLLGELTRLARDADCLTLTGRAADFERDLPFAVIIDAFDSYLHTLDDRAVERLSLDRQGALAAVFPALSGLGDLDGRAGVEICGVERRPPRFAASAKAEEMACRRSERRGSHRSGDGVAGQRQFGMKAGEVFPASDTSSLLNPSECSGHGIGLLLGRFMG